MARDELYFFVLPVWICARLVFGDGLQVPLESGTKMGKAMLQYIYGPLALSLSDPGL